VEGVGGLSSEWGVGMGMGMGMGVVYGLLSLHLRSIRDKESRT